MKIACLWQALALLAFCPTLVPAADLRMIERTIVKEPSYNGKPKYCLLVFGPEAKTRIWLVVDDSTLYVDRNGNGDLTEKDERVEGQTLCEKPQEGSPPQRIGIGFGIEKVVKWQGKDANLMVWRIDKNDVDDLVNVFPYQCTAGGGPSGVLKFSDRAQDAPIIHFNGPLSMALRCEQTLSRKEGPQHFSTMIGTPGLGKGTFAAIGNGIVPKDIHPVAEFEFPNKKAGGPPVKARFTLSERC